MWQLFTQSDCHYSIAFKRPILTDLPSVKQAIKYDSSLTVIIKTVLIVTPNTPINRMSQMQQQHNIDKASAHGAHELMGRFSSKSDFVRYFKEQLQLYVPPDTM